MALKKLIVSIHRWLGLVSGLVVFVLAVTGCILAFEAELRNMTEPFRKVKVENRPYLPPSQLKTIAEKRLISKKAWGVEYPGKGKAATASYWDETHYEMVFINPYSGEVLKHKDMNKDFFRVILDGHFYLWLPHHIGQPISASATLIFLIMIVTGLILWWPRNKVARKQRFTIKWNVRWRRKNYDLHNVLGFYMSWIAIFIAITGLVFGFQWFAKSVYWVGSGGQTKAEDKHPLSDTTQRAPLVNMTDYLWENDGKTIEPTESISVWFANQPADPIEIVVNHRPGTYYNSDFFHYDQFTGKRLKAEGSWEGKFSEAKLADKIVRMNYDIHTGAVLGFAGKVLAFLASLVAASLPVTGFLIWRGRRKKVKNGG